MTTPPNNGHPSRLCLVCREFDVEIPALAIDRGTGDEGDLLCARHRALAKEGYCVLCGRREPGMKLTIDCSIGWCRPCLVERRGEEAVLRAEAEWAKYEGSGEGR
jgi:hypothetical protein